MDHEPDKWSMNQIHDAGTRWMKHEPDRWLMDHISGAHSEMSMVTKRASLWMESQKRANNEAEELDGGDHLRQL